MELEPRHGTLVDIFEDAVKSYGPRQLFGTKKAGRWQWLTYSEFAALVDRFRGGLDRSK
jgi:long-chain acyl-CoA synthetase